MTHSLQSSSSPSSCTSPCRCRRLHLTSIVFSLLFLLLLLCLVTCHAQYTSQHLTTTPPVTATTSASNYTMIVFIDSSIGQDQLDHCVNSLTPCRSITYAVNTYCGSLQPPNEYTEPLKCYVVLMNNAYNLTLDEVERIRREQQQSKSKAGYLISTVPNQHFLYGTYHQFFVFITISSNIGKNRSSSDRLFNKK